MSHKPVTILSPFNGGTLVIPPEFPRDTLAALLERGFTLVDPDPELVIEKPTRTKGQK